MRRFPGLFLAFLSSLAWATPTSTGVCQGRLQNPAAHEALKSEMDLLQAFDPKHILKIEPVSERGSAFKVITTKAEYLLRAGVSHSSISDIYFESFAAHLVLHLKHTATPQTRLLGKETSDTLRTLLLAQKLDNDELQLPSVKNFSLAVFYPNLVPGVRWLEEQGYIDEFWNFIFLLPEAQLDDADMQAQFDLLWSKLSPAQKEKSRKRIEALYGNTKLAGMRERLQKFRAPQRALVRQMIWKELPKPMRESLAHAWATTLILGMADFHANNWLTEGKSLLLVDLAYRTEHFDYGTGDFSYSQAFPLESSFNWRPMDKEMLPLLRKALRPAFKRALENLSGSQIRDIAKKAGFAVSDEQVRGMLARIRALLGV